MSILNKIKSKYNLQNLFNFVPYNICLRVTYKSNKLIRKLDINKEQYKQFYEIKKILKPSYDINRYFKYLSINDDRKNKSIEKILYGCLNDVPFNINLIIENSSNYEYIIKNIYNAKLIISPSLLKYDIKGHEDIFDLLNFYKNNISEICFTDFNNNNNNLKIINKIMEILKRIFEEKVEEENNKINNNLDIINISKNNNTHKIKKLTFESNNILSNKDIIDSFFTKIDNIISLNKIQELYIGSYDEEIFSEIIKNISKKMKCLRTIKIFNFGFNLKLYKDLNFLLYNLNDRIEIIDLSDSFCFVDLLSIYNLKFYPLKILKLKLYSYDDEIDWKFIYKNKNTLEDFEIETNTNFGNNSLKNMIINLNKVQNLKKLKIISDLKIEELIQFNNIANIESLDISLNLPFESSESLEKIIYEYFIDFEKLKSLSIKINDIHLEKMKILFVFPPKLTTINFKNIIGSNVISLLKENKNYLTNIEELKLDNCYFNQINFKELNDLFNLFNSLQKLSLKTVQNLSQINSENSFIYEYIPSILQSFPSLLELDISNNKYNENIFKSLIFEKIKSAIPRKIISLKIFNNEIPISNSTFIDLKKKFGFRLDLENNYPNIEGNNKLKNCKNKFKTFIHI